MVLIEIVYVADSNPWINGPQYNFTFLPESMYLSISCFGKTGCNELSHLVVVFAVERGSHVVISVTLWDTAIQTFGHCNKYLRKLALAWVYLASPSEISAVVPGSTVSCQKGMTEQKCSSCTGTRSDRKWPETRYASKGCPQWPIFSIQGPKIPFVYELKHELIVDEVNHPPNSATTVGPSLKYKSPFEEHYISKH